MKVIKKLVSVLMAGVLTLSVMACSGTDRIRQQGNLI